LAGRWGKALRADLRRLNRWSYHDRVWLRNVMHHRGVADLPTGKFNAGQKLNAAFVLGVMGVMLMTGCIMRWVYLWPVPWRTGASFVHVLFAYLLVIVVAGHVYMALTHPQALRSIFTGRVSRDWAKRHASVWLEEVDRQEQVAGEGTERVSERAPDRVDAPR
ncbi:MAG TPA: cytochrome b/b6 domain-containing protein, partial [Acidimicrobiales bacterium]|nr:cytochrome b/b6 domain-containing protein [Acidimicrobiales bacterium]